MLVREQCDFFDARYQLEFATQEVSVAPQFRLCETVAGNSQENAVDVSKIVDHHRFAADRRRQTGLDVVDLATQFIPDLRDPVSIVLILHYRGDYRPAARRLRFDATELTELLAGAFDRIGDLLCDFLGARARIRRDDQRFLDRELRILQTPQVSIRHNPARNDKQNSREHDLI